MQKTQTSFTLKIAVQFLALICTSAMAKTNLGFTKTGLSEFFNTQNESIDLNGDGITDVKRTYKYGRLEKSVFAMSNTPWLKHVYLNEGRIQTEKIYVENKLVRLKKDTPNYSEELFSEKNGSFTKKRRTDHYQKFSVETTYRRNKYGQWKERVTTPV